MYNHSRQYRCTIIRGKSQREMDNLLPLYAKIIDSVCPCNAEDFAIAFNNAFNAALTSNHTNKTIDNHRTEIAGKLFGMYYISDDKIVYPSERTRKFIADSDTPAFFKDICYKMQFPNGSQAKKTVIANVGNEINIRQFPFLLKVLLLARSNSITLTKKEIGYYILNSLDVLQGNASPSEVYDVIAADRLSGTERSIAPGSRATQHVNEQINLLELANLIIITNGEVAINPRELDAIQLFAEKYADTPEFNVYAYNLARTNDRKRFYADWGLHFSRLSDPGRVRAFDTTADALGISVGTTHSGDAKQDSTLEIGDEGEKYVFDYEKRRVTAFNFRLAGKVIHLGKTRGLGYDIQSVVAKEGGSAEFVKYIEVKSTKRVTVPKINDSTCIDTLNMTRNEWVASQQHGSSYSIFRVYFVRDSVIMYVLTDIAQKYDRGEIQAVPTIYRLDFDKNAVDEVI